MLTENVNSFAGKLRKIAVNPTLFYGAVLKTFDKYILDLLDKNNLELRQRFASKLYRDFGIKLNAD